MKGKVKFFNRSKGFGFIVGEDGKEYFVHHSAVAEGLMLRDNDEVTFDPEQGERGPKAVNVKAPSEESTESTESGESHEEPMESNDSDGMQSSDE